MIGPHLCRINRLALLALFVGALLMAGCATGPKRSGGAQGGASSYTVFGQTYYVLASAAGFEQTGKASWYGRKFHGQATASGRIYDMYELTAAHKTLPLGTLVRVTNLSNGRQVRVRINDRGPFHGDRIIDLSYAAARRIGMVREGTARVRVTAEGMADSSLSRPAPGGDSYLQAGAFAHRGNALTRRRYIRRLGVDHVSIQRTAGIRALYRVRIGPFAGRDRRQSVRRELETHGINVLSVND